MITIAVFLSVCVLSAIVWHYLVTEYLWATIAASLTTVVIAYIAIWLYRGQAPWDMLVAGLIGPAFIIALGVGIPFYRRRNGKGLEKFPKLPIGWN